MEAIKPEIVSSNKPTVINAIRSLIQCINSPNIVSNSTTRPLFFKPGVNDKVFTVFEDEPSSAIANSLSSVEYAQKFESLSKTQKEKELTDSLANYKGTRPDIEGFFYIPYFF